MKNASFVIVEISSGRVIFETFNLNIEKTLNKEKYKAVPILEYLCSLNNQNGVKNDER